MAAKELKALIEIGTSLGYTGDELKQFISEERMRMDREKEEKEKLVKEEKEREQAEKEKQREFELEKNETSKKLNCFSSSPVYPRDVPISIRAFNSFAAITTKNSQIQLIVMIRYVITLRYVRFCYLFIDRLGNER